MANLEFQIHFKCSCVECRRACRHRGKMQTPLREAHGPGIEPVSIFRCRDAKVQGRQIDLCEDTARNRAIFCITTPSCPHAVLPIDKVAFLRASALNQRKTARNKHNFRYRPSPSRYRQHLHQPHQSVVWNPQARAVVEYTAEKWHKKFTVVILQCGLNIETAVLMIKETLNICHI